MCISCQTDCRCARSEPNRDKTNHSRTKSRRGDKQRLCVRLGWGEENHKNKAELKRNNHMAGQLPFRRLRPLFQSLSEIYIYIFIYKKKSIPTTNKTFTNRVSLISFSQSMSGENIYLCKLLLPRSIRRRRTYVVFDSAEEESLDSSRRVRRRK